jgi:hypothetical protein
LDEINNHVTAQIEHQEMVDRQEMRLESLDQYMRAADIQAGALGHRLSLQESAVHAMRETDNELRGLLDAQHARVDEQRVFIDKQINSNDNMRQSIAKLEALVVMQKEQIDDLKGTVVQFRSAKAALLRNGLSLAALALATLALLKVMPPLGA